MGKARDYRIPATCHVCGKKFLARYNVASRAKVCTPPTHACKATLVNGKKISCPEKCCRDRYRRASSSMALSALDSRKYLNPAEFGKTLRAIRAIPDEALRMGLWFSLETGCRVGEITLVRRHHLDWRPGPLSVVSIPTEKKVGHPPLPVHLDNKGDFVKVLRKWADKMGREDQLFPVGVRTIQRTFEKILDFVKPDRGSLVHILRHTRASRLTESGLDPNTIRAEMRWSSIELLKVYSHTTEAKVAKALGRIR